MQKYRFVLPRRNFKPARPDPWRFQTRPTPPAFLKTGPNPTLPARVPDPTGRVGSGCRTLILILQMRVVLLQPASTYALFQYSLVLLLNSNRNPMFTIAKRYDLRNLFDW